MSEYAITVPEENLAAVRRPVRRQRRLRKSRVLIYIFILVLLVYVGMKILGGAGITRLLPGKANPLPDGIPAPLLELLEKNPETYDFVIGYNPDRERLSEIDISGDTAGDELPLFLQWDERWGYDTYGSGMIAVTGCGPACLAMVAVGLLGDESLNPRAVADFSAENGYYTWGSGTKWTLMTDGAEQLGLCSRELPLHEPTILSELQAGNPVICSVGSGDFTTDGHYIVLTGINTDGTVSVNDPNSIIRSGTDWDLGVIMEQVKNLWAFSKNV